MKVKDLERRLFGVNPEADVQIVVNNYPAEFTVSIGGGDGCTDATCDTLAFMVGGISEATR